MSDQPPPLPPDGVRDPGDAWVYGPEGEKFWGRYGAAGLLVVLSLGSSLGGLLLLSTTELGARLIGADGPTDIHPIVPVTIVAITVALSTDYEVMLISRMAEHHRATGDDRASIVTGVAHTGGVITSAAVIMVAVFSILAARGPARHRLAARRRTSPG